MVRARVEKTVFENGLTVVTERVPHAQGLSAGIWVPSGSRHEADVESGVSHFLEHMLFKGTKSRNALAIARAIDQVGGEFNAFTAREQTCYHLLLLNRDYRLACDVLSDIVLNSTFDARELEKERQVILQEVAMIEDTPDELVHDLFMERVYRGHPIGRTILGSVKRLKALKRATLVNYFRNHYRPDRVVFAVAGDVAHSAILRELGGLRKRQWPGRPAAGGALSGGGVPQFHSLAEWHVRSSEQVHWVWGVPGPSVKNDSRFAAALLNLHLGAGMSSLLFQEIREKRGLAYTVFSNVVPFDDSGIFAIYAATAPESAAETLALAQKCVDRVTKRLLDRTELKRLKDNLEGTILLSGESIEARMHQVARNEMIWGRDVTTAHVLKRVTAVTATEVRDLARTLFGGERAFVAIGPKPPASTLKRGALREWGVSVKRRSAGS